GPIPVCSASTAAATRPASSRRRRSRRSPPSATAPTASRPWPGNCWTGIDEPTMPCPFLKGQGTKDQGQRTEMSSALLPRIASPADLKILSETELERLAEEMRQELIGVVGRRSAHFASNLGVVELCLALHLAFDFGTDRLIWDTGHQIYPHKLITGRAAR